LWFLLVVSPKGHDSIPTAGNREAPSEHERGSEAGGGADSGVTPAEPAILDIDDERDRFLPGFGLSGRRGDRGERAECRDRDRGSQADPTGCDVDRVHA
jgi:hypothetical protein